MAISNYSILKNVLRNWLLVKDCFDSNLGYRCLDAEIRLNWECNARCKMCGLYNYIAKHDQKRKVNLSLDEVKNVVRDLSSLGCTHLTLSGGEPTLSPILTDVIDFAAQEGMEIALNTNGYLLDEAYIVRLIEAGLKRFTFSIDSPIEAQHDEIRGLKGCFQHICNAIDVINKYNMKNGTKIYILVNCVLLKENIRNVDKFIYFYEKHHFDYINFSPASIGTLWDQWTTPKNELRSDIEDVLYFKKEVFPLLKEYNWPLKISDPYEGEERIADNIKSIFSYTPNKCYVPFFHTVIQSNGDVIPCCYTDDGFTMGNIREMSLQEIWNNEKYKCFRESAKGEHKMDMCQSCRQYMNINNVIDAKRKSEEK